MKDAYTAVVKKSGKWWIGWIEEVPGVNCQEPSKKELLESLQETLREALSLNRREALERLEKVLTKSRSMYEAWRSPAPPPPKRLRIVARGCSSFVVAQSSSE
jgi:hypothetical protein